MKLHEKVDALSTNPTVPRLGVVGTGHVEGPHGLALGGPGGWEGRNQTVIPTTEFPQYRGLGQTCDPALIQHAAALKAFETRYALGKYHRGGLIVRAPNADLSPETQMTSRRPQVLSLPQFLGAALLFTLAASAAAQQLSLTRDNATVLVEPYAPNVVRVSLSLNQADALAAPGYGISAKPLPAGWSAQQTPAGDILRSNRLVVTVSPQGKPYKPTGTAADIAKFFNGSTPYVGLSIKTPEGASLVQLQGWQMSVPNHKDGNADILYDRRPTDHPFFQVGASFASPPDEHYYGLGQNQEGFLDRRNHVLRCAHDYNAPSGQSVCVPFVVTNKGYGIVWDNPSITTVAFGFNDQVRWTSDVGQRVSFFVIAGKTYDEIYSGYRVLTGDVPMLPKSAYGYIQCKQRYSSQEELMAVAKGYRDRHYPIDDLVIDWFHYTKMGEMDMDPAKWPDPVAMNRELHAMNFHTMISVWPRFVPESRYYATVLSTSPTARPPTAYPTTAPAPTSTPPIPTPVNGIGASSSRTTSTRASTPSGPTKPSPTSRPTEATGTSAPAPNSSTSFPSSTPRPSTTACARTCMSAP
jgi:hypothetical protein